MSIWRILFVGLKGLGFSLCITAAGWFFFVPASPEERAALAAGSTEETQPLTLRQVRFAAVSARITGNAPEDKTFDGVALTKDEGSYFGYMEAFEAIDGVIRSALAIERSDTAKLSSDDRNVVRSVGGAKFVTMR